MHAKECIYTNILRTGYQQTYPIHQNTLNIVFPHIVVHMCTFRVPVHVSVQSATLSYMKSMCISPVLYTLSLGSRCFNSFLVLLGSKSSHCSVLLNLRFVFHTFLSALAGLKESVNQNLYWRLIITEVIKSRSWLYDTNNSLCLIYSSLLLLLLVKQCEVKRRIDQWVFAWIWRKEKLI